MISGFPPLEGGLLPRAFKKKRQVQLGSRVASGKLIKGGRMAKVSARTFQIGSCRIPSLHRHRTIARFGCFNEADL
jgi:hypothetical protein